MRRTSALIAAGSALVVAAVVLLAAGQFAGREAGAAASAVKDQKTEAPPQAKVDLNRAGTEDLARLPGISRVLAERIAKHRPYRKLDDVVSRGVLGKKQFARIREFITIGPPSP